MRTGVMGRATTGDRGGWKASAPPEGGICAMVGLVRTAAASQNLIISHAPETGRLGASE